MGSSYLRWTPDLRTRSWLTGGRKFIRRISYSREARGTVQTTIWKDTYDYLAPDGSEIRLLLDLEGGSLAHCTLPPGRISVAQRHRTVG